MSYQSYTAMSHKEKAIITRVLINDIASNGWGLARVEGKVVFVKHAVPGDLIDVQIDKSKSNYAEGTIHALLDPSEHRRAPTCTHFGLCGGCSWQHIDYTKQLEYKSQIVHDALVRIGKLEVPEMLPIVGSDSPLMYRNKMNFEFTDYRWLTTEEMLTVDDQDRRGVGFHLPGRYLSLLNVETCYLQADPSNAIRRWILDYAKQKSLSFFNIKSYAGLMRSLMIRSTSLGEWMVMISFGAAEMENIKSLLDAFRVAFPDVTCLQYVINTKRNDTFFDLDVVTHSGRDHILETIGGFKFKIHAKSFFQTNSSQAEKLYAVTKAMAGLQPSDKVYDLYTGVGSIAIYVSRDCAEVIGVEEVETAIHDARINAEMNGVGNTTFYAGDVRMIVNAAFIARHGRPDVVITDPPRAGMHQDVIKTLLDLAAPRIVYVSCNPATQARDMALLSEKYHIVRVQPVDMFPQTVHIESVALLELK
jgi:23S rRNA (uracil1939-C5)-methyltransferase